VCTDKLIVNGVYFNTTIILFYDNFLSGLFISSKGNRIKVAVIVNGIIFS